MLVVTKGHAYLVQYLLKFVWPFVTTIPSVKVLIAVLKIFAKFLENHLQQMHAENS